jgi:chemotaxis protein histidine kinase CheA
MTTGLCAVVINDMLAREQVVVKNLGRKLVGWRGSPAAAILVRAGGVILDIRA